MPTVSELVEDLAAITGEPVETVRHYARELQRDGQLPKASGRAVPNVNSADIGRLLLALALNPRVVDTSKIVQRYWDMRYAYIKPDFPDSVQERFGEAFSTLIRTMLANNLTGEFLNYQKQIAASKVDIFCNWTAATINISTFGGLDSSCEVFEGDDGIGLWRSNFARKASISMNLFNWLGGIERDYGGIE